jgi:hypothetical protein
LFQLKNLHQTQKINQKTKPKIKKQKIILQSQAY